jgi:hypothetical protein
MTGSLDEIWSRGYRLSLLQLIVAQTSRLCRWIEISLSRWVLHAEGESNRRLVLGLAGCRLRMLIYSTNLFIYFTVCFFQNSGIRQWLTRSLLQELPYFFWWCSSMISVGGKSLWDKHEGQNLMMTTAIANIKVSLPLSSWSRTYVFIITFPLATRSLRDEAYTEEE